MTDGRKADAFTEGRRKSGVARPTNILLALGILFLLPSTLVIVRCQDDTNMQWQTVTAILDQVSPGDIVYLNPDNMLTMYHILRARGAKVYPVMDDLETTVTIVEHETEQAAGAENSDESITGSAAEAVDTDHHDRMQRISSDDNQYTYYLTNSTTELLTATGIDGHHFQITIAVTTATQEDDLSSDDPLTNMPHEFSLRGSQRYVLYRD